MSNDTPTFRLTYATMFDPPASLHERFDAALQRVRQHLLGGEHPMTIGGVARDSARRMALRSPIDHNLVLGHFALGNAQDTADAVAAASAAGAAWAATPVAERIALLRRVAAHIEHVCSSGRPCSRSKSARTAWKHSAKCRRRPT